MSVHIFVKLKITEGREAAVQAAMGDLIATTRAEDGCIGYDAFVSTQDPTVIRLKEEWRDMGALQAHMAAPHFQKFGSDHAGDMAEAMEADVVQEL